MDRKEFLSAIGMSSAVTIFTCLGCSKGNGGNSVAVPPSTVDFTLDLSAAANAPLLNNGGYVASNGVLVAKSMTGQYIAVQQSCTHENYPLIYDGSNNRFFCNNHAGTFNEKGAVTGGPPNSSLTAYKTQLNGSSLRIFS